MRSLLPVNSLVQFSGCPVHISLWWNVYSSGDDPRNLSLQPQRALGDEIFQVRGTKRLSEGYRPLITPSIVGHKPCTSCFTPPGQLALGLSLTRTPALLPAGVEVQCKGGVQHELQEKKELN